MWGGSLLSATCVSTCHVTTRITQVLLSGASGNCLLPLCTNSLFRKWEEEKITDQRHTNSLTSSSCLSTFRTSCVFSSEREKTATYWSADSGTALHDNNLTPPQRGKRGGERKKETGRKQHTRTHLKIYLHILSTRRANIWCLLVIGVYEAFVGFCWGAVRHLVPTQREGRCQLCSLARSMSPTQND